MVAANHGPSHYYDAIFILLLVSSALCRGRSLPTQPIEGNVPGVLSITRRFHSERMARRHARCRHDGDTARHVLHGLLRSSYAAPFRRCRYGFALGRGLDDSGDEREASARSKNLAADDRCWADCRRCRIGDCRLESDITQNSAAAEFLVVRVLTLTISRRAQSCRQTLVQGSPCACALLRRAAILYQQRVAECRFRGLQKSQRNRRLSEPSAMFLLKFVQLQAMRHSET